VPQHLAAHLITVFAITAFATTAHSIITARSTVSAFDKSRASAPSVG
jgi:hypothetical protein